MWKLTAEQKEQAVVRYQQGESAETIGQSCGVTGVAIRNILIRRGIELRTNAQSHITKHLDHMAFDNLTDDALYWAGFIAADGTLISARGPNAAPELAVVLTEADRPHLLKLRAFLGSTHAITHVRHNADGYSRNDAVRFSVRSHNLWRRLTELGVRGPKLSLELTHSPHFWRGVVDGDGWIGQRRMDLVGYPYVTKAFVRFLHDNDVSSVSARPHKMIERVACGGRTADRVLTMLYQGCSTALDRKYEKAVRHMAPDLSNTRSV